MYTCQVRLNRVVHIRQCDALFQHLLFVHLDELLWHARNERGEDRGDLRALARSRKEFCQVACKERDVLAGAILKHERDSAGCSDARNRRRREAENRPGGKILELLVQTCLYGLILFGSALSLVPGFQADPEEAVVTGADITEQTEANHASRVLDARCVREYLLHLSRSRAGAFQ